MKQWRIRRGLEPAFSAEPSRQIHPPKMLFTAPEQFLDDFTTSPLDITTLAGDWPFAWAYYDEPSNREALLLARTAHNQLLAAERIYAALSLTHGFQNYPTQKFEDAWKANVWPDHGWGGNHGLLTDAVYAESYGRSKTLSDQLLGEAGSQIASQAQRRAEYQIPVVVFNPSSWERTDVVECRFRMPISWTNLALHDSTGKEVPYEVLQVANGAGTTGIMFLAGEVPAVGYKTYYLTSSSTPAPSPTPLTGDTVETPFYRLTFGGGGIKSLYDKRLSWKCCAPTSLMQGKSCNSPRQDKHGKIPRLSRLRISIRRPTTRSRSSSFPKHLYAQLQSERRSSSTLSCGNPSTCMTKSIEWI